MSIRKKLSRWLFELPKVPRQPGLINVLMVTNSKKNQGFYRDAELARQTNAVRIFENFPYENYNWDARRIIEAIYGDDLPDVIYIHYNRNHTYKIKHMDKVPVTKLGFVGDPQDFIVEDEKHVIKRKWMADAGVSAYFTIAPQVNWMVWKGLEVDETSLPIINSHLAVDPQFFYNMHHKRKLDVGSFGAHTDTKYPFRIEVRNFLKYQKEFKTNRKQRVGKGGNNAERFAVELNRYKSCFTCASVYGYTVAKYFEIPACGTLLFGERTDLLDPFGYIDGVNFVEVTPENFVDKFHYYLHDVHKDDRLAIAAAGEKLVHERHTWKQRMAGVVTDLEALLNKKTEIEL